MGWDIEMYAELRRQNRWVLATPVVLNPYFDYSRPEEEPQQRPVEIYKERNSALFAILAGVGPLAGEESPFPCISPPRGVPSDLSSELATWHAQLDGATFAESWLLLAELLNFDWHGIRVLRRGMVESSFAHAFRSASGDEPDASWPKGVEYSYADQILAGSAVEVRWWESCAESVGSKFLHNVLPKLQSYGRPEDLRIVFWFNF